LKEFSDLKAYLGKLPLAIFNDVKILGLLRRMVYDALTKNRWLFRDLQPS